MQKKIKNKSPKLYKPDEEIPFEELKEGIYHIELEGLPKWSTNNMYSGGAYYSRKQIKDRYKKIIREQFNKVVRFKNICAYEFQFKTRALDASNCSGMAKMIEDCIIWHDSYRSLVVFIIILIKDLRIKPYYTYSLLQLLMKCLNLQGKCFRGLQI